MSKFQAFLRDESGASAAEYALILAIVGVGIATAAVALSSSIKTGILRAGSAVNGANAAAAAV